MDRQPIQDTQADIIGYSVEPVELRQAGGGRLRVSSINRVDECCMAQREQRLLDATK